MIDYQAVRIAKENYDAAAAVLRDAQERMRQADRAYREALREQPRHAEAEQ